MSIHFHSITLLSEERKGSWVHRTYDVAEALVHEFDEQSGWGRYIQPLDRGSFNMSAFLQTLRQLNYAGPVGLQCYGLTGDARDHLSRSIAAWRKLNQHLAENR